MLIFYINLILFLFLCSYCRSPLSLDSISQQNAIAAAAAAAAACNNDPNKFQELLMERTKALVAAEALKNNEGKFYFIKKTNKHYFLFKHFFKSIFILIDSNKEIYLSFFSVMLLT